MAILLFLLLVIGSYPTHSEKPNILILMADDLGIGDVGCFGNNTIRTPNIDRLAKEGVKLTHHIAPAAFCTPSRSAFLTGRYPIRLGMTGHPQQKVLIWNAASGGLPENETTFANILKQTGYTTGMIGKWHLGVNCGSRTDFCHHPLNHGFDYFFGTPLTLINDCDTSIPSEMGLPHKPVLWFRMQIFAITLLTLVFVKLLTLFRIPWKIIFVLALFGMVYFLYWYVAYAFIAHWNCILMRNFDILEQPMEMETKVSQMVKESSAFISRYKRGPFLLFVSFLHIHTPYSTTEEFRGKSQHDLYGDNIEEMDWMIGEILDTVKKEGLMNNTLIYFTSDNGGYLEGMIGGTHLKGSNGIYRGGKGMGGMEGGIRIPGILHWPGMLPANTTIDNPTSLMDLFTTVVKLAGASLPEDRIIDGKDLMPLAQRTIPTSDHEFMFHYCDEYLHSVRWQDISSNTVWKVHYMSPKFTPEGAGACYGSKFCACTGEKAQYHDPPLLFNLSDDPSEMNPLASDTGLYRKVIETTHQAVLRHNATLQAVPQQLYGLNNMWNPMLQPCCGTFPMCWCNKSN